MNDSMTEQQSLDYLARFGLQREPFDAAPDPAFFCADSVLMQRLDMLQNLTEFGMLTLLVIGAPGVGKTSILQQYLQRANNNWQLCHLETDNLGNAHDLVEDLATGFHVPGADLAQLRSQLDELRAQGRLAVLVVDDAERLPDTALRTLLELSGAAAETEKRLRLVLFGTDQLQEKIAGLSPEHADNTHVFNIPPLSELQTAAYLQHRLKVAGLQEDAVFTSGQVKSIVKVSHGVPAQINARARQLLIDRHSVSGSARTASTTSPNPLRRRLLFAAAVVGALLIVIALWPAPAKHVAEPSGLAVESDVPVPEKTVDLTLPNISPAANPAATGASAAAQIPAAAATPLPVPTLGPEVAHPVPTSPSGKIIVSSVPAPEAASPPPVADKSPHATARMTTVTLPVAPTPAPAVPEKKPIAITPTAAKALPATKLHAAAVTASAKSVTASHGSAWLQAQRPGDYTLQILGGSREPAVRRFVAENRLTGPSTILHTTRNGKPWYILLYGAYPSRTAASQALTQLSATVRAAKPWPRSFTAVRGEIAK